MFLYLLLLQNTREYMRWKYVPSPEVLPKLSDGHFIIGKVVFDLGRLVVNEKIIFMNA